jgi:hypothetical protein
MAMNGATSGYSKRPTAGTLGSGGAVAPFVDVARL